MLPDALDFTTPHCGPDLSTALRTWSKMWQVLSLDQTWRCSLFSMDMTLRPSPLTGQSSLIHNEFGTCSCRWTADRRTQHMQSLRLPGAAARLAHSACTSAARAGAADPGDSCQSSAPAREQHGLHVHRRDVLVMSGALAAASRCSPAEVSLSSMLRRFRATFKVLQCCRNCHHCCTNWHHYIHVFTSSYSMGMGTIAGQRSATSI